MEIDPDSVTEAGGAVIATVAVADPDVFPAPVQESTKVVGALIGPTCSVPAVARVPVQPFEAVQAVALVVDHVSVAVPPCTTDVGCADNVTVGFGVGLPPPPPPPPPQPAASRAHATANDRDLVMSMSILVND
ncbi:hypothetical protein GCM10011487_43730 [Steroidobacter agaridevorans]|uniref:Uncharacterized protein n=1 Tax=Steroidobacter agaridevorans TaxID=2695856 RepID=A0A829YHK4_9GAMM|nr:hypothetical protein [Steroidobacter agaridevorans]GFE82373.1 hypothetical protein GCM10011487_43730 [Steroidobacter agaridevorans]